MFPNLQHFGAVLLAQTGPSAGGCAEGGQLIFPIAMVLILYFVWLRPMNKERRTHAQMLDSLMRGDDVVTSGGIFGKVADISPKIITLEVAKNVKIRVLRSAIAKKTEDSEAPEKSEAASKAAQK